MQSFHPLMHMLSYLILGVSRLTLAQVLSKQASWQPLTVASIKSLTWLWLGDLTVFVRFIYSEDLDLDGFGPWAFVQQSCTLHSHLLHKSDSLCLYICNSNQLAAEFLVISASTTKLDLIFLCVCLWQLVILLWSPCVSWHDWVWGCQKGYINRNRRHWKPWKCTSPFR